MPNYSNSKRLSKRSRRSPPKLLVLQDGSLFCPTGPPLSETKPSEHLENMDLIPISRTDHILWGAKTRFPLYAIPTSAPTVSVLDTSPLNVQGLPALTAFKPPPTIHHLRALILLLGPILPCMMDKPPPFLISRMGILIPQPPLLGLHKPPLPTHHSLLRQIQKSQHPPRRLRFKMPRRVGHQEGGHLFLDAEETGRLDHMIEVKQMLYRFLLLLEHIARFQVMKDHIAKAPVPSTRIEVPLPSGRVIKVRLLIHKYQVSITPYYPNPIRHEHPDDFGSHPFAPIFHAYINPNSSQSIFNPLPTDVDLSPFEKTDYYLSYLFGML